MEPGASKKESVSRSPVSSNPPAHRDQAAGHSNVCAGYAALKRWQEALEHCNRALDLDRGNWRTYNNRAAVFVGLKQYDLAMTDVNAGLEIAPNSSTLLKSREVVIQHNNAATPRATAQAQVRLMNLPEQVPGAERSQFALLGVRRFLPFFLTQFFGAFNDNLFRIAFVVSMTYGATAARTRLSVLSNVAQGLFILPFFLFSALAGQLADKYEKSRLIRQTRFAEVILMCCRGGGAVSRATCRRCSRCCSCWVCSPRFLARSSIR